MSEIAFKKMQSLGNDFMLIDTGDRRRAPDTETIRAWADRRTGVGFDQLLMLSGNGDETRCDIYNADGSSASQCGNGARCVAAYLHERGAPAKMHFVMGDGAVTAEIKDDGSVSVWLASPSFDTGDIGFTGALNDDGGGGGASADESFECVLPTSAGELTFGLVSMGNPHAVTEVKDIAAPVADIGSEIQAMKEFGNGVNVGFMQVRDRGHILLRVVERGCGETNACGSGACAAVVIGSRRGVLDEAVKVDLPGGSVNIEWRGGSDSVKMTGPSAHTFDGNIKVTWAQ